MSPEESEESAEPAMMGGLAGMAFKCGRCGAETSEYTATCSRCGLSLCDTFSAVYRPRASVVAKTIAVCVLISGAAALLVSVLWIIIH